MLSRRLSWEQKPNAITRGLAEKRAAAVPILDLTQSNPTQAGLPYPREEILEALAPGDALVYQPDPRGLVSAREAIAEYYRQRAADLPASRILVTASTSEAYAYLFKLLANPGDEILAPRPSYPLFEFLAGLESVRIRSYPLRYDGAWHIDFDALERAVTGRTRAIVAVNPNNPTGSYLKRDEFARLAEIAWRHRLAILSDEVFSDFAFTKDTHRVPNLAAAQSEAAHPVLTFSMSGLSKIAGLPQMKLGWIAANGPGAGDALHALELIADTYLSVATPVQIALPQLLDLSGRIRTGIRMRTAANRELLGETVHGSPATLLNAEGGWYAILQVPRTRSEEEWVLGLLEERDVLVQPGFFFDFESEAFLVLSLLTEPATFADGVRHLREFL